MRHVFSKVIDIPCHIFQASVLLLSFEILREHDKIELYIDTYYL
jgi:hypothetical protein